MKMPALLAALVSITLPLSNATALAKQKQSVPKLGNVPAIAQTTPDARQFSGSTILSDGTPLTIDLVATAGGKKIEDALSSALAQARMLETQVGMSTSSLIAQINQLPKGQSLVLPPEAYAVLKRGINLATMTDGWFDITAPSTRNHFTRNDYRRVKLNDADNSISFTSSGMKLDTTWLARAAAVDAALQSLAASGITQARVEASGITRTIGRDLYTPWTITVEMTPSGDSSHAHRAMLYGVPDMAVAVITPQTAANLVDPRTKEPVHSGLSRAAVWSSDATTATALAVAAYTLGAKPGINFLERYPSVAGLVVSEQGELLSSKRLFANRSVEQADANRVIIVGDRGPASSKLAEQEEQKEEMAAK